MNTRGKKKLDEEQGQYFEWQDKLQYTSSPMTPTQGQLVGILSQLVVTQQQMIQWNQQMEERLKKLQETQSAWERQQDERLNQTEADSKYEEKDQDMVGASRTIRCNP